LAVAGWVSARVHWARRRPSSSPCDRVNCVSDHDSPLVFAVILSPVVEGWAVGCFQGQFLRQTELIKRSLCLTVEPTWWCLEPEQFLMEQQESPGAATPVPGSRFPDRWLVAFLRRSGSPRRSVVDCRTATTIALPPGHPKLGANSAGMPAGTSAMTPAVAGTRESAGGSVILFTPPPSLAGVVEEAGRRVSPGANAFLPRRQDDRAGSADQEQDPVTLLSMVDLDAALSNFRD